MNFYNEDHKIRKQKVVDFIAETAEFVGIKENGQDAKNALLSLKENVDKGVFSIVLVGEYSTGKSTFLNALMQKKILPSFSGETTATVNFLRHSSEAPNGECGIVYYTQEEGKEPIPPDIIPELTLEEIEKVVSTKGNRDGKTIAETVAHVDLFLDSQFLKDGVMLVDSPGFNGMASGHKEIAEKQIQASHACIYLFSAHQAGKKSEFDILRNYELRQKSRSVFFVLNQIDTINTDEQPIEVVIDNIRKNYAKVFPDENTIPEIWPVSAMDALTARDKSIDKYRNEYIKSEEFRESLEGKSLFSEFEDRLWQYITQGERTKRELTEPVNRCISKLREQREDYIKIKEALENQDSSEEITRQREAVQQEIEQLEQTVGQLSPELKSGVDNALRDAKEKATTECKRIKDNIKTSVEIIDDPEELIALAEELGGKILGKLQNVDSEVDDSLRNTLLEVVEDQYNAYFSKLQDKISQTGGIEIKLTIEPLKLTQLQVVETLTAMDSEIKALEAKIAQEEANVENLASGAAKARKAETDRQNRLLDEQKKLDDLYKKRENFNKDFVVPDVITLHDTKIERVKRGGLAQLFAGDKIVTRQVEIKDTSARDAALAEKNATNAQY